MRPILCVVLALVLSATVAGPAAAAPGASVNCTESANSAQCDVDHDRITDALEKQICGSTTCATGREDRDRDGIPDWVEFRACGSARCANTATDDDADGIPNFAELLTCGSSVCSTGREDADTDKIADWIEFVICGDRTCANGSEDYDADGISDAKQLAACEVAFDVVSFALWAQGPVSVTVLPGKSEIVFEFVWWPILVGAGLSLLGLILLGLALWAQRRRDANRVTETSDDEAISELLGSDA